ncbi:SIR2 family NAD-dependent protein deacylase [Marinigracilibium pacificum]|uniref:NAD-dependent protein deacylase n=1 Tax=Marinigracilibium pacificum TaxID=2729599 RepID=A0A848J6G4_9BACT|nr:NAD-dependent deacylase [Marinigracilibium pacificum]NMM50054.1 NAD-dependent deacylase [Marinigracilibium pacificum]
MQKLVVLTGAGISAESGIATFRDANGLWEGYDVTEVASPSGWDANPELVLDFYNQRRKNVLEAQPNPGHLTLVDLEDYFDVTIVTQNVDDLHERAGSTNIIHLHGEIMKARSTADENLVYNLDKPDIKLGDVCEKGSQLRPHIVWFGEMVPMMEPAIKAASEADLFIIAGTSLQVYPAAGLFQYCSYDTPVFLVDPSIPSGVSNSRIFCIEEPASTGIPKLKEKLINEFLKK